MNHGRIVRAIVLLALVFPAIAQAQGEAEIFIADKGATQAIVVTDAPAKPLPAPAVSRDWERRAATDLVKYIGLMTGAQPALADTPEAIDAALKGTAPVFMVGEKALAAEPGLKKALAQVAKPDPVLRADAITLQRRGNRIYLAGSNDESHYFAVSHLLQLWGCRWYLPTEFGECIPEMPTLKLGALNVAYAPPFEVRHYWLSWNGNRTGADDFQRRNFMSTQKVAGMGHALGKYTADLAPEGKSMFNVAFAKMETAQHVADRIAAQYEKGTGSISLAIEDGAYQNDSPEDAELQAGLRDKYFFDRKYQRDVLTDPMMAFYNNVAKILREKYPESKTKIGGMAYVNVTIPPQRAFKPEKSLVMWLAPIDIDPNHGMDDPKSPPKQEYREMVYRWAELMEGRLVIYDYDQGQLVWRDVPNPVQGAFKQDVLHYRKAGILGIGTESRGALGTIFLNLFFRGQLMWNPDADVDALLTEFYPKFFGPAAQPMANYWNAIFEAWKNTISTEHEFFVIPAIYTPELMATLGRELAAAEKAAADGQAGVSAQRLELYRKRVQFTRMSYDVLKSYTDMATAAATNADYKAAGEAGVRGLAAVLALTKANPTFTTGYNAKLASLTPGGGASWWPGEVKQYQDLDALQNRSKGTLVTRLPVEWAFHRDPNDTGMVRGWAYKPVDLTYWNANRQKLTPDNRKEYPTTEWEMLRTDIYAQGQGIRHPDGQSYTGHLWYRTDVELTAGQSAGNVHIMFPGLFNEAWLYVNGNLVRHRPQNAMWWNNNYKFEWDIDLSGSLKRGKNIIAVRCYNPHHFGGMFRRPFLYRPVS